MYEAHPVATLEPVRFGEFLRDRKLIDEEQWLAVLADHWSAPDRRRIGETIVARGFMTAEEVEAAARAFHEEIDVIEVGEVDDAEPSAEPITAPMQRVGAGEPV